MNSLLIHGMHGMGDNIHQRAVLRALMPDHNITLETSWPCIYRDLVGPNLRLVRRPVALRTQLKNAEREAALFSPQLPMYGVRSLQISYGRATIGNGTILSAMFAKAGIASAYAAADYTFPINYTEPYVEGIVSGILGASNGKPICVYRPLTARPEWRGGQVRNANADDYAAIFATIRDCFFVVSVADLEPQREWIIGPQLRPDVTLHAGELSFEALAALFASANLVFTSSGFASILAPAVRTPCISIQGGFEPSQWHIDGSRYASWFGIDPLKPCNCGTSACTNPCSKKVDVPRARGLIRDFVSANCGVSPPAEYRPITEMFDPPAVVQTIHMPAHTLRQKQMPLFRQSARGVGIKA